MYYRCNQGNLWPAGHPARGSLSGRICNGIFYIGGGGWLEWVPYYGRETSVLCWQLLLTAAWPRLHCERTLALVLFHRRERETMLLHFRFRMEVPETGHASQQRLEFSGTRQPCLLSLSCVQTAHHCIMDKSQLSARLAREKIVKHSLRGGLFASVFSLLFSCLFFLPRVSLTILSSLVNRLSFSGFGWLSSVSSGGLRCQQLFHRWDSGKAGTRPVRGSVQTENHPGPRPVFTVKNK